MSILSYFKWKETPSEYLERTEVECVVTVLKSVESKGEWWCKFKNKNLFLRNEYKFLSHQLFKMTLLRRR